MAMLFAIAWRNLWRNKRRTLITMSAVAGGLAMILIATGFMHAMGDRMLEAMTSSFLGHAQIHKEGFRAKKGAGLTVANADRVLEAVRATKGVKAATGRIYGLGHVSVVRGDDDAEIRNGGGEDISAPVAALLGIEPAQEKRVTDLATNVIKGRWLEGETDVVVGSGLAKRNGIEVGDAFLPTSVDSTGAMRGPWAVSDEVPRVVGIVKTGMEEFDNQTAFLALEYFAKLHRMEGEVHEVVVRADSTVYPDLLKVDPLVAAIKSQVAQARTSTENIKALPATGPLTIRMAGAAGSPSAAQLDAGPDAAPLPPPVQLRLAGVEQSTASGQPTASDQPNKLLDGTFITQADDIVLARPIAAALKADVGQRVVVDIPVDCGPDVSAEECPPIEESFTIVGIVTVADEPLLDGRFGLISAAVLSGNIGALNSRLMADLSGAEAQSVAALSYEVRGEVGANDEILAWYDLAPEIRNMLAMLDAGPLMFLFIIFLAVSIGIVNTMLMATFERTRELGMMMALGMRPIKVVAMVMTESALLGLLGVLSGLALGSAIVGYWTAFGMNMGVFMEGEGGFSFSGVSFDPVLWPRLTLKDLLVAGIPVFIMTSLAGLWPAIRASRLRATDALRQD